MLTILFDGIAYGMLLFVLACGLAVTLGLMNFVNLAHGAFAMAGGYCTVILVNRLGRAVPRRAAARLPVQRAASALVLERTLYVHVYAQEPSRSGAVHHRPRVHVGRGGRLRDGLAAAVRRDARLAAGPVQCLRRRHRPLPAADHRGLRPADASRCSSSLAQHALRQPAARRGRRRARRARARHQRRCACSPSPSRSARGSPASAARSAPRSSGSIRPSRSSS